VVQRVPSDPRSIERGVRQRLADKISDSMFGLWLLVPEHLRLGTWDLLCAWTQQATESVAPRLALQLVHEAALCTNGLRAGRCLTLRGFETVNGLPFLAEDKAVHEMLAAGAVAQAEDLQVALGKLRRASGHFAGRLLLIDPHRPPSFSRRHMRKRPIERNSRPIKTAQTFFSTTNQDSLETLTRDYPTRWHIEEFYNREQALGWHRAGTMNLNIRYGQMTMSLLAQTLTHQLRKRLGAPFATWDARHLASEIFRGLEGDIRVEDKTIVVTYYNAPNQEQLRSQYEGLPAKLKAEGVNPEVPWLYGFQLDFRFR
jgi:hypothetical protein